MMSIVPKYIDQSGNMLASTLRLLVTVPILVTSIPAIIVWIELAFSFDCGWLSMSRQPVTVIFIACVALALVLLYIPQLPERLGRWFLPATLLLCTIGPLSGILIYLMIDVGAISICQSSLGERPPIQQEVWLASFSLLIPLLVIAWQYRFPHVALYAIGLLSIDVCAVVILTMNEFGHNLRGALFVSTFRTLIFLLCGYLVSQLVANQRRQQAQLVRAHRKLEEHTRTLEQLTVSQERNRLARDLHDTLAHYLSGLVLELEGTRLVWQEDEAQARKNLNESIATARLGLVETRRALKALRSSTLDELGLLGAIRKLVRGSTKRNGWHLTMDLPNDLPQLYLGTEEAIYRIVQEAATNIERHARATAITIRITIEVNLLCLYVKDNGIGFECNEVPQDDHFGLNGIIERANLVGGQVMINSHEGQGTTIQASFPLESTYSNGIPSEVEVVA